MMDDKLIQSLGIDLSDPAAVNRAASDAEAEAKQREEQAKIVAYARAWDKMMQRAFKGIYPRPLRHKMMQRNLERKRRAEEREASA